MSTKFTGAVNSEWFNNGNWSGGVVPSSSDDVVFDATSPNCHLDFAGFGAAELNSLNLTGYNGTWTNSGADFRLLFDGVGGNCILSEFLTCPTLHIVIAGAFITFTNPNGFHVSDFTLNSGTLKLGDFARFTHMNLNGGGTLNVNGQGMGGGGLLEGTAGATVTGLDGAFIGVDTMNLDGIDLIGGSAWSLEVDNAPRTLHNCTITNCDASSSPAPINATDNCVDGGGNTNIDFASPGGASPSWSFLGAR